MEWATPTVPDLTINFKKCSVQPRRLTDPESTVWISLFPASRLDPTSANGGARLKHAPQILWKQNRDVLFLTRSCLKLAIKDPSLSTFSVCRSGAEQENQGLLHSPEVKFSRAPQRYRHILILSHQTPWSQTTSERSCTSRALHLRPMQLGARTRHSRCPSQSWQERSVLVLLCSSTPYLIFSYVEKKLMLQFI